MTWLVLEWRNLPVSDFGHLSEKSPTSQNPNKRYLYAPHLFGVPILLFPHKGSLKYLLLIVSTFLLQDRLKRFKEIPSWLSGCVARELTGVMGSLPKETFSEPSGGHHHHSRLTLTRYSTVQHSVKGMFSPPPLYRILP